MDTKRHPRCCPACGHHFIPWGWWRITPWRGLACPNCGIKLSRRRFDIQWFLIFLPVIMFYGLLTYLVVNGFPASIATAMVWVSVFTALLADVLTVRLVVAGKGRQRSLAKIVGTVAVLGGILIVVSLLLVHHYYQKAERQLWKDRYAAAASRLDTATEDHERFYPLTELAQSALYLGFTNDARAYAQRLLAMAPNFKDSWNYGNAVHDGNAVLGRIAVQEGRLDDAKRFLIEAGKTPGSPQLDSFGPDMRLAQDLLERGERETVLEYLKLCRRFWEHSGDLLDQWSQAIKAGKTPDLQDKYP